MDPKIQSQVDAVKLELSKADHLTPEHRDLLDLRLNEALECSNGTPEKLNKIATVVAIGAIGSTRQEIRLDSRMSAAVTKGMEGFRDDVSAIITTALKEHTANCPYVKQMGEADDGEIFGIKAKTFRFFGRVLEQSPQLTGIAMLFVIYKIVELIVGKAAPEALELAGDCMTRLM
jgi:hypothetical protein